jgi:hypothetical protein
MNVSAVDVLTRPTSTDGSTTTAVFLEDIIGDSESGCRLCDARLSVVRVVLGAEGEED